MNEMTWRPPAGRSATVKETAICSCHFTIGKSNDHRGLRKDIARLQTELKNRQKHNA